MKRGALGPELAMSGGARIDQRSSKAFAPPVLHVMPANGGGVDRYVRDVCAFRPQDPILHVAAEQVVLEIPSDRRFWPISVASIDAAIAAGGFGTPVLIHAHSTLKHVRTLVTHLCASLSCCFAITLHDIEFARDATVVGEDECFERRRFVRDAALRLAPSNYLIQVLAQTIPDVSCIRIEHGVDVAQPGAYAAPRFGSLCCDVAVIGAMGTHKGLQRLQDVVAAAPEIRVVLVGYADGQLNRGWLNGAERIWVHGAFEPTELPMLVQRYGCRVAFFPNIQPEGFGYALSDAWGADLPALVPDVGALAERVLESRAGWLFPDNATTSDIASRLEYAVAHAEVMSGACVAARDAIPSRATMVSELNEEYALLGELNITDEGGRRAAPVAGALDMLCAKHLDGAFFRSELRRLEGDLVFQQQQATRAEAELREALELAKAREEWANTLTTQLAEIQSARALENAAHREYEQKLVTDVASTLQEAHRLHRALDALPRVVRRWAMQRADRHTQQRPDAP